MLGDYIPYRMPAKQAKQRAMIKARVTNTLGKRPWDNHT